MGLGVAAEEEHVLEGSKVVGVDGKLVVEGSKEVGVVEVEVICILQE